MSNEATGQSNSGEVLTGRAALEHDAGYVPYVPEHGPEQPKEELTVREAARKLTEERSASRPNVSRYVSGVTLPANVTMTLDQAANVLSEERAADKKQAELDNDERVRAEADKLRGVDPEAEAKKAATEKKGETVKADDATEEAEPDLEKVLNHPKVKEALSAQVNEAQTTKEAYGRAIDIANQFAQAAFAENFPEIAGLPRAQWEGALRAMAVRDPARFQKAMGTLQRVATMQHAARLQEQSRAEQKRTAFDNYAKQEDARFADMVKDETPERMRAIEIEIPKMIAEYGVDPREFFKAGNESQFLRSAAAQKVLVDAAKYRLLQAAKKAVATKPIPHVMRPGAATEHVGVGTRALEGLKSKFNANPSLRNAAALLTAQRRAAKRG